MSKRGPNDGHPEKRRFVFEMPGQAGKIAVCQSDASPQCDPVKAEYGCQISAKARHSRDGAVDGRVALLSPLRKGGSRIGRSGGGCNCPPRGHAFHGSDPA